MLYTIFVGVENIFGIQMEIKHHFEGEEAF